MEAINKNKQEIEKIKKEIEILLNQIQKHLNNQEEWGYNLCQKQIEINEAKLEELKEQEKKQ